MKSHFLTLAGYHAWATATLFDTLVTLDDARYRADCGLFFRSVHGTLNHLLVADNVWFARLRGEVFTVSGLDAELEQDRDRLEQALCAASSCWQAWLEHCDDVALGAPLRYRNMSGASFEQPLPLVLSHVFNHGTHHRGQISTILTQAGLPAPEMDLVYYLRRAQPEAS